MRGQLTQSIMNRNILEENIFGIANNFNQNCQEFYTTDSFFSIELQFKIFSPAISFQVWAYGSHIWNLFVKHHVWLETFKYYFIFQLVTNM